MMLVPGHTTGYSHAPALVECIRNPVGIWRSLTRKLRHPGMMLFPDKMSAGKAAVIITTSRTIREITESRPRIMSQRWCKLSITVRKIGWPPNTAVTNISFPKNSPRLCRLPHHHKGCPQEGVGLLIGPRRIEHRQNGLSQGLSMREFGILGECTEGARHQPRG